MQTIQPEAYFAQLYDVITREPLSARLVVHVVMTDTEILARTPLTFLVTQNGQSQLWVFENPLDKIPIFKSYYQQPPVNMGNTVYMEFLSIDRKGPLAP